MKKTITLTEEEYNELESYKAATKQVWVRIVNENGYTHTVSYSNIGQVLDIIKNIKKAT